ncbi:hypothetical protein K502DRAFT_352073 [Neoconidiobolus thromboides FSU 785]|nr:hypothetical protein K502DRAFT_352073 [Neoconidiobolus thromboides FSU 785]
MSKKRTIDVQKSYRHYAAEKLDEIELKISHIFEQISERTISEKELILLSNYIKWIGFITKKYHCILEKREKIVYRKNGKEKYKQIENTFFDGVNKGTEVFIKLNQPFLEHLYLSFGANKNLLNELNLSVVIMCGLKPSQLFHCFANVYCSKMDPNSLWLSRENLLYILRSKKNNLLKVMLFQALIKLIKFESEETANLFRFEHINFEIALKECFDYPCIENITAIVMYISELYFSRQLTTAHIYIQSLIHIKDAIMELEYRTPYLSKEMLEWKERLWEMIEFYHLFLGNPEKTSLLGREIEFNHVKSKIICAPTLPRLSNEQVLLISSKDALLSFESKEDILRREINSEHYYYSLATWVEMETLRVTRKQVLCLKSGNKIKYDLKFHDNMVKLTELMEQINIIIKNTPSEYKKYALITKKQAYYMLNHGKKISDRCYSFGSYAYSIIIECRLLIMDPLSWNITQPHKLTSLYSWDIALLAANEVWDYLDRAIEMNFKTKDVVYPRMNNCICFRALINFSLNVLANDVPLETKWVFYKRLNELLHWLKYCTTSEYGFPDSSTFLNFIVNSIPLYNFSNQFSFSDYL